MQTSSFLSCFIRRQIHISKNFGVALSSKNNRRPLSRIQTITAHFCKNMSSEAQNVDGKMDVSDPIDELTEIVEGIVFYQTETIGL